MLLDLQRARVSSVTSDLNYFLYTSMDGAMRSQSLNQLIQDYYSSFWDVMEAARLPMPFSIEELYREFCEKNIIGFIYGMNGAITQLLESEGIRSLESENPLVDNETQIKSVLKSPVFTGRVKYLVDEMIEKNVISV